MLPVGSQMHARVSQLSACIGVNDPGMCTASVSVAYYTVANILAYAHTHALDTPQQVHHAPCA